MTTVTDWLRDAVQQLQASNISSSHLDAELMLADSLDRDRSWLIAHNNEIVPDAVVTQANSWLQQRCHHIPLAYLRGWVEFYGRQFQVTPAVLIPRPESEMMIELLRDLHPAPGDSLIDIGTGSGCLGITAAMEFPGTTVTLTDISPDALTIARRNATTLHATVETVQNNLLFPSTIYHLPSTKFLLANLPYVAPTAPISPDAHAEPPLALFAEDDGYALMEKLITQASEILLPGGYLLLEMDPWQQDRIVAYAQKHCFHCQRRERFHLVLMRVAAPDFQNHRTAN